MKKFLLAILLSVVALTSSAQIISFRTTAFSHKERTTHGWSSWSNWESDCSLMTMDLTNDMIVIYTQKTQYYNIISIGSHYREGNAEIQEFGFIDQDGDRGTFRLVMRSTGRSEVYIAFNNVTWGYIVKRL